MEIMLLGVSLLQSFALSLGVGASTLAVVNYVVASADGVIDQAEQRLMKIVYVILRIAMVVILLTAVYQSVNALLTVGVNFVSPFLGFLYFLIAILFVNAFFMTKRMMPRAIGPSLQAASWYGLSVLNLLYYVGLTYFTFTEFFGGYLILLAIMMVVINGSLAYFRVRL